MKSEMSELKASLIVDGIVIAIINAVLIPYLIKLHSEGKCLTIVMRNAEEGAGSCGSADTVISNLFILNIIFLFFIALKYKDNIYEYISRWSNRAKK